MRLMINFSIPLNAGNELVTSGKIGQNFQSLMEDFQPEAAYLFLRMASAPDLSSLI